MLHELFITHCTNSTLIMNPFTFTRQLTGQSSSTPLMSIRDGHSRKVSFDTREELGNKIDKLVVMIGKLATRDSRTNRQFKPQICQSRGRGQNRSYNQRTYQNRYRSNNRSSSGDRGQYRQNRSRPTCKQNYRRGNFRGNLMNFGRQHSRREYRNSYRNNSHDRSRNRSRERLFSRNYGNNRTRSTSNNRSRSGSRPSTNRDRIHCYKYREYDHFTRDCPTSREEKEIEQLQQMLNLGDEQTITPPNTQDNFSRTSSEENLRTGHLNL